MEEEFYADKENANLSNTKKANLSNTIYYLAGQYSNLGLYEKALTTYQDLLGKKILTKNINKVR